MSFANSKVLYFLKNIFISLPLTPTSSLEFLQKEKKRITNIFHQQNIPTLINLKLPTAPEAWVHE